MRIQPIEWPEPWTRAQVVHVALDRGQLAVAVLTSQRPDLVRIFVDETRSFRVLDESQLLEFWGGHDTAESHVWEILEGGWLDQEPRRFAFLPRPLREYLIVGDDDCVNVVAHAELMAVTEGPTDAYRSWSR
jgi:hypothetical protein